MAHVPSRANSCLTCRQRNKKVRIDVCLYLCHQKRTRLVLRLRYIQYNIHLPVCKACIDGGRKCEGYTRYQVCHNRTVQGIAKRKLVEEVKRPRCIESRPASSTSSIDAPATAQQRKLSCNQGTFTDSAFLQPGYGAACEAQLISTFWDHYIPQQSVQNGHQCEWLQQTLDLPNPSSALRLSLKALAMARIGWIHRDDTLSLNGRVLYSQALQAIQRALYDERTMWQDETLATGNVLAWYEVEISP